MSGFHETIGRATERLRHDRELRLDVSHELQTHLDASVEEYHEAGYEEDAAEKAALKDLGDPEELAEDLWRANRFRMRLRPGRGGRLG